VYIGVIDEGMQVRGLSGSSVALSWLGAGAAASLLPSRQPTACRGGAGQAAAGAWMAARFIMQLN
jgi:hypothetical protein